MVSRKLIFKVVNMKENRSEENKSTGHLSRREFFGKTAMAAAGLSAASLLGSEPGIAAVPDERGAQVNDRAPAGGNYNILFILTDQERHFRSGELPIGFSLPAHERLAARGTVFENHRINSCVCTPSRSVVYTGRHIQDTKMFDNTNFPWINSMSTDLPTVGHMMREAGYYTAYKGKWHLTKEFETVNELGAPMKMFTKEMDDYGFGDYFGIGDLIGHDHGGYIFDGITSAMSVSWLKWRGTELAAQGKPWFMAVNLVNPHDVMFLNTDKPGQPVQAAKKLGHIQQPPVDPLYDKQWQFNLPTTYTQALDAPGRPLCHKDYMASHDGLVGNIANEDWRWMKRHNYYLNCLRDVDRHITPILDTLDELGMAKNTIIIMTADHGDLDGAHRLHAKGATAYREQNNVPLVIVHPDVPGGRRSKVLTSHVDLAPTIIGFTGASPEKKAAITKKLPGKDISSILANAAKSSADAIRDGALFCYNMFAYLDGDFMNKVLGIAMSGPDGKAKLQAAAKSGELRPDMRKRGAIRGVFDGRYQFTRYHSPKQHNKPKTVEDIFKFNDVELFDHQTDPLEMNNLAMDPKKNGDLLEAMSAKLNKLIEAEVGEDVGQMLPGGVDAGWVVTKAVSDV